MNENDWLIIFGHRIHCLIFNYMFAQFGGAHFDQYKNRIVHLSVCLIRFGLRPTVRIATITITITPF